MLLQGGAVTPAWSGKVAVCIATGPSLCAAQLELVRAARAADAVRVVVVNDAYLVAPWADVLYYADTKWRGWQEAGVERRWPWQHFSADQVREAFAAFRGQKCSVRRRRLVKGKPELVEDRGGTQYLDILLSDGLSLDPRGIATGGNSGHMALNIAALSGAKLVLLLGYDARPAGQAPRDVPHAFGEHPDKSRPPYVLMRKNMKSAQAALRQLGVRVINCTPGSAIECFERGTLEGFLSHPAAAALPA